MVTHIAIVDDTTQISATAYNQINAVIVQGNGTSRSAAIADMLNNASRPDGTNALDGETAPGDD